MIAEDDESARLLLRTLAELETGVELVGEARTGAEAVDLVQERGADAALLDVNMPVMDGVRAAELLRDLRPGVTLLLHTAEPGGERWRRAKSLGLEIIAKTDFHETLAALQRAVAKSSRAAA